MSQSLNPFDDKCKTGTICPKSGIWCCKDHPAVESAVREGDYFPECHHISGHNAIWWYLE